jgi:hypothetical protein
MVRAWGNVMPARELTCCFDEGDLLGMIGVGEREGRIHNRNLRGEDDGEKRCGRLRAVKRDRCCSCCVREDEGTVLGGKYEK